MINLPPGNWPEWFGALGTVGVLVAALIQIARERSRLRTDHKEQLARERRAQAELVSAWIGDVRTSNDFNIKIGAPSDIATNLELSNASGSPVYRAVLSVVDIQGIGWRGEGKAPDGYQVCISIVPPGRFHLTLHRGFGSGMGSHMAIEIAFTDAAGKYWVRRASGRLDELTVDPVTHYQVTRPVGWMVPTDG